MMKSCPTHVYSYYIKTKSYSLYDTVVVRLLRLVSPALKLQSPLLAAVYTQSLKLVYTSFELSVWPSSLEVIKMHPVQLLFMMSDLLLS